jgi:methionine-rich copper-binding protein CopC
MKRLASLCALLFIPVALFAHVYQLECNPPENAVLSQPPEKVTITFLGSVEPVFSKVEVFDMNGNKVSKKTICREDDTIMEAELDKNLPAGEYTVKWMCMSLDGHKQKGEYTFKIEYK